MATKPVPTKKKTTTTTTEAKEPAITVIKKGTCKSLNGTNNLTGAVEQISASRTHATALLHSLNALTLRFL